MNRKIAVWTCLAYVVLGCQAIAGEVSTVFVVEANGGGGSVGWAFIFVLGGMRLFGRRDRLLPVFPKGNE